MELSNDRSFIFSDIEINTGVLLTGAEGFSDIPVIEREEAAEQLMTNAFLRFVNEGFLVPAGNKYRMSEEMAALFNVLASPEKAYVWSRKEAVPLLEYEGNGLRIFLHMLFTDPGRYSLHAEKAEEDRREKYIKEYFNIAAEYQLLLEECTEEDIPEKADSGHILMEDRVRGQYYAGTLKEV